MTKPPASIPEDATTRENIWAPLRQYTVARIGLPRSGASLATAPLLEFKLAHARARDAVHMPLDEAKLIAELAALAQPVLAVSSAAADRQQYLMRPDLGRQLASGTEDVLAPHASATYDVVFIIADGLSARAVQNHAPPLLARILSKLTREGWAIAPPVVARRGRVALGDAVATELHAKIAVVLIGERPGLSAPDSMGAYLTWQPGTGATDADRNCISNIRPEGLGYTDAAFTLIHLLRAMRRQRMSGVQLKDDTDRLLIGR